MKPDLDFIRIIREKITDLQMEKASYNLIYMEG